IQVLNTGLGGWAIAKNLNAFGLSGIDTANKDYMFTVQSAAITSIKVSVGGRNTSPTQGEVRYRRVYFKKFTYPGTVLSMPKLLNFYGTANKNAVTLNWQFETTDGLDNCVVERANGNNNYQPVAYFMMTEKSSNNSFHYNDNLPGDG